ncbi:MAG: hypothetical protein U0271_43365 [Polyangiaceae bacterium]
MQEVTRGTVFFDGVVIGRFETSNAEMRDVWGRLNETREFESSACRALLERLQRLTEYLDSCGDDANPTIKKAELELEQLQAQLEEHTFEYGPDGLGRGPIVILKWRRGWLEFRLL